MTPSGNCRGTDKAFHIPTLESILNAAETSGQLLWRVSEQPVLSVPALLAG